jgi:voltage-gated potassium channel
LFALVSVFVIGSTGYYVLQNDATLLEAAYMTVITVSTVGYAEVIELDALGRLWTMFVIVFGVGTFSLAFSSLLAALVSGEIRANRERRRMQSIIDNLKDHVIVCGYGRVGSLATADLIRQSIPVVVIESNDRVIRELEENQVPYVNGDATEDDTLAKAGLDRARFLVTTLPSDADNVYVTLSARGLRPDLHILARAEQAGAQVNLRRAGANHVVCPQTIGAGRLAALIAHPHVVEFVEVAAKGVELEISEYLVEADSSMKDKTLRESDLRRKSGGIVVAIKQADGETLFSPDPDVAIRENDTLVIIGTSGVSERLDALSV